jgi:acetoin utilization deacetylase AcuC-like enzyme
MTAPVLYMHPSSLEHDPGPHPERADRIRAIEHALGLREGLGFERRESPAATRELLHAAHPPRHVDGIEELCAAGGGAIDADTFVSPGSFVAACHAAGGAVAMVDALLGDGVPAGASLHRPPGHHAEADRAMGFCLFNNVAVAARHALDAHGAGRVLILDWDVHHGNGTAAIFRDSDEVLFVSIHEWPLYPGTGAADETGLGAGEGWTVNLPVPGGSGDETFCSLVEHVAAPLVRAARPDLVLISAGFDAHSDDPLATCEVSDAGYAVMAGSMVRAASDVGVPVGVVLEGGYDLGALARGLVGTLAVVGGVDEAPAPPDAVHPLAQSALERLASGPGPSE